MHFFIFARKICNSELGYQNNDISLPEIEVITKLSCLPCIYLSISGGSVLIYSSFHKPCRSCVVKLFFMRDSHALTCSFFTLRCIFSWRSHIDIRRCCRSFLWLSCRYQVTSEKKKMNSVQSDKVFENRCNIYTCSNCLLTEKTNSGRFTS